MIRSIGVFNAQGLNSPDKLNRLLSWFYEAKLDILAITETHFYINTVSVQEKILHKHRNIISYYSVNNAGKTRGTYPR